MTFNPWRWLRSQPDVTLEWVPSLPEVSRYYPDDEAVLMRTGLDQVTRRCSIAHELAHRELGHRRCKSRFTHARQEREAEFYAARMMVDIEALVVVMPWATCLEEAAEELWVDVPMLEARLSRLSVDEQAALNGASARKDEAA